MNNIWLITKYTIKEAFAKRIIIFFTLINSFFLLIFGLLFAFVSGDSFGIVINTPEFNQTTLMEQVAIGLKVAAAIPLYWASLLLSIFAVANLIPSLTEKGNIDLFLSKPISRIQLLLGKFIGGNLIVILNVFYFIFIFWLLIGFKFGIWDIDFLYVFLLISFTFSVLYSMIILLGVITKSSFPGMAAAYLIIFILSPLLENRLVFSTFLNSAFIENLLNVFYYIIPQTSMIGLGLVKIISGEGSGDLTTAILSSAAFLILMLGSAIFIFSKKDY